MTCWDQTSWFIGQRISATFPAKIQQVSRWDNAPRCVQWQRNGFTEWIPEFIGPPFLHSNPLLDAYYKYYILYNNTTIYNKCMLIHLYRSIYQFMIFKLYSSFLICFGCVFSHFSNGPLQETCLVFTCRLLASLQPWRERRERIPVTSLRLGCLVSKTPGVGGIFSTWNQRFKWATENRFLFPGMFVQLIRISSCSFSWVFVLF